MREVAIGLQTWGNRGCWYSREAAPLCEKESANYFAITLDICAECPHTSQHRISNGAGVIHREVVAMLNHRYGCIEFGRMVGDEFVSRGRVMKLPQPCINPFEISFTGKQNVLDAIGQRRQVRFDSEAMAIDYIELCADHRKEKWVFQEPTGTGDYFYFDVADAGDSE